MAINFENKPLDFSKAIEVQTGQLLNFSKDNPGVTKVRVELYWSPSNVEGIGGSTVEADGDVAVVITDAANVALPGLLPESLQDSIQKSQNKLYQPTRGLLWYNNLAVPGVIHSGDALSSNGADESPEETIHVDFSKLETEAKGIIVVASTHSKTANAIPFSKLANCKALVINDETNEVIYQYRLNRQFSDFSSVELGSFFYEGGEWEFTSMGSGVGMSPEALSDIAAKYKL